MLDRRQRLAGGEIELTLLTGELETLYWRNHQQVEKWTPRSQPSKAASLPPKLTLGDETGQAADAPRIPEPEAGKDYQVGLLVRFTLGQGGGQGAVSHDYKSIKRVLSTVAPFAFLDCTAISIYLSIDRSIDRSIYRSVDRSIYLSIYRSIHPSI